MKFCCEKELSGCETASVTCQDHSCHPNLVAEEGQERSKFSADHHHQMADSSNGNGKLEETEKVQEGEVVESVRDIAIDDYSVEHAKKTHEEPAEAAEESPEVVESGDVVEEKEDEVVPVSIVEKETSVVEPEVKEVKEEKEEEQYVPSVAETDGPSPVVEDDVSEEIEEKTKTDLVSNGVEESTLPSLSEVTTNVVSKGIEETEVPCSEEKEEEEVVTAAAHVVSKGIEEVKLPVVEEISTGESSGADYKATSESVDDETLKPSPEVPVPPPVESTDAGEGYGKREIPETAEKPVMLFKKKHSVLCIASIIFNLLTC